MTASLPRASADAPRAAVYCRISDDRRGLGLGVERQREDCLDLARRNGWRIVGTFVENDISAYSGKPRPQYAELMAAVDAGEIDVVVAWDPTDCTAHRPSWKHSSPPWSQGRVKVLNGAHDLPGPC